jgi:hypothetical protein
MRFGEWESSTSASEVADTMADLVANGIRLRQKD